MFHRLTLVLTIFLVLPLSVTAQTAPADKLPRTEFGFPDLQGYWTNASQTPLQRSGALGEKRYYTTPEVSELEATARQRDLEKAAPLTGNRDIPQQGGTILFQAAEPVGTLSFRRGTVTTHDRLDLQCQLSIYTEQRVCGNHAGDGTRRSYYPN